MGDDQLLIAGAFPSEEAALAQVLSFAGFTSSPGLLLITMAAILRGAGAACGSAWGTSSLSGSEALMISSISPLDAVAIPKLYSSCRLGKW